MMVKKEKEMLKKSAVSGSLKNLLEMIVEKVFK
jgi:hypothetical protein